MRKLITLFLATVTGLFAVDVTFTVVDNSWANGSIRYKGTATTWALQQMYDDGTNGDATAGDHTWTIVLDVAAGDHEWGAIDTYQADGTTCEACDGSDGWGTWLIQGSNNVFSVSDAGDVTGTTSYTIDAFTASAARTIVFTVNDLTESYLDIEYKGTATSWALAQMYDDGTTGGDVTADDHIWTITLDTVSADTHEWGAIENDGSEWGVWLIAGPNPSFTLDEDLVTYHGHTNYIIPAPSGDSVVVTFTINDGSWMLDDVMIKGTMSGWGVFQAYDDGTNGDATAADHIWTGQNLSAIGDHAWGGISTTNPDGTVCVACDGSDGWGSWLMEGHPNPEFSIADDGTITGVVDWVIAPDSAESEGSVMFTVHDQTGEWTDLMWKGTPSDDGWTPSQMYNDGTNGDVAADDSIWTIIVANTAAGNHSWGAIDKSQGDDDPCVVCDGSDGYGTWLIEGENPAFTLDEDLLTLHGQTDYAIMPALAPDVTKTVLFNVDLTEWLDEEGNPGLRAFNIANGDEMQVRGSFNNWGNCTECTMTRTPGTNIFSLATEVTAQAEGELEFAYYMHLSDVSLAAIAQRFGALDADGNPAIVDWIGWETSPRDQGNRKFMLGADDGSGLLELPLESFYDAFPGSVVPEGTSIEATFSINMNNDGGTGFDTAADSVYIRTHDKWLNLTQGFSDGQDLNHYGAVNDGTGIYNFTVTLNGPVMWQVYYKWGFKDVSEGAELDEAGGGLGDVPRIRYLHQDADADCAWPSSYHFTMDTSFVAVAPSVQEPWDSSMVCISLTTMENDDDRLIPEEYSISDNYPNPFNPSTQMEFSLPVSSDISFTVYSLTGVEIYSYSQKAVSMGKYKITWNGRDSYGRSLPSGVYLYEFRAGDQFRQTKKMTLLK